MAAYNPEVPMLIAHITDTHITSSGKLALPRLAPKGGAIDTSSGLARAVAVLEGLRPVPDITIVTGDLVDAGEPQEYAHFRDLLAPLRMPVFVIPGNHDAREPMRQAFVGDGYFPRQGFLNYVIDGYPLRIVGLDTLVPGEAGGELCGDRLKWIDDTLSAAPDRPTLILMHHPPFRTGIAAMDRMGLDRSADFSEIIGRHPQVERICCGHIHRAIESRFAGTIAGTAPSTAHQATLDLRPDVSLTFAYEPPGYQLHLWNEDTGLVTHTGVIDNWRRLYKADDGQLRIG
jgi:3',5'-cyclic-AMP phosphodiesterase